MKKFKNSKMYKKLLNLYFVMRCLRFSFGVYNKSMRWKSWGYLKPMFYDGVNYAGFAFGFCVIGWEY